MLKLIGMGHELEHQVPLLQSTERSGVGQRARVGPHRADPAEAWRRHLPLDELDRFSNRIRRGEAADDGMRTAAGMSVAIELDGLLD